MRSVKKETMDELARITRKYWSTGDTDILDAKNRKASELSEQAFGSDEKWLQFCDILDCAICLNRNLSNDIIYKIFGLLCIEVSAPVEERITRRPRLTEEQVDELKAAVKLGLFWLAKDESGTVSYYRDEPRKSGGCQIWFYGNSIQSLRPPQCSDVASLVSWSDPAPLDIVQTLRDAGVEVDDG